MNFNKKMIVKIPLYIGAILLLLFLFMPGCDRKMPHEEGYVPRVKVIELKEVGRCKDEQGTLFRVNYVGFNTMNVISKAMYLASPNMGKFCIPDLDEEKRNRLSKAEQQQLDVAFFNARDFASGEETIKDAEGNVSYQSVAFRQLKDLVKMGSELAYLELHLFNYEDPRREFEYSEDNPYYQRLKHLAKSGNAEAMCLFSMRHPSPFVGYEHLKLNQQERLTQEEKTKLILKRFEEGPEDKWRKGSMNAAKSGSSYCMYLYGSNLLRGDFPNELESNRENNKQKGMKYLLAAAEKGNADVAASLSIKYLLGSNAINNFVEYDLGKYKCWSQIYNQSFPDVYKPILFEQEIKWEGISKGIQSFTEYDPSTLCQTIKE